MRSEKISIPTAFSGANTGHGFVSFYDSFFKEDKLSGLYIIKGGSGTGKSTFMRRLGEYAIKMGHSCEHYLCGSDANSLDGIIINGKKSGTVGVIDGTPPHPRELRSPGAAGDILNFGSFWDSRGLRERRREIDGIAKEKTVAFDTVYRYLGAANNIDRHISSLTSSVYMREKGLSAAKKIVTTVGARGSAVYRQLSAYTMNGEVRLKPNSCNLREYVIAGNEDIGRMFLADAEAVINSLGISAEISRSPLNMEYIDGIFFPESGVWLYISTEENEKAEKVINTRRFIDKEKASLCRQRLRFGKKCRESLMEGAFESLKTAQKYHFRLEDIYKEYMDFNALSKQSELWYREILSRLD